MWVDFVSHAGNTTALEFGYNGNHPDYLNGSTLTLTTTISGLTAGTWLSNIQISYDTLWNKTASFVTETWSYSVNGSAYISFDTVTATGNAWQTESIQISGITLYNGDILSLRNTFSDATGNNGGLDFDNLMIGYQIVPEPSAFVLVILSLSMAILWLRLRLKANSIDSQTASGIANRRKTHRY